MTLPFSPAYAVAFVLALVRASAWVVICPPFANKSIPAMAKIGISLGIAVEAAVTLQHETLPSSDSQILAQVLVQASIGFVLGFVVSLFVTAVVAAGSLIDLFAGLNLPQALDPLSLQQTPIIGQFYNLVATALLFTTGSVLVIVDGFLRSFKAVGTTLPHITMGTVANVITGDVTTFFAAAVEIAAPVIVVLFRDPDPACVVGQVGPADQRVRVRNASADPGRAVRSGSGARCSPRRRDQSGGSGDDAGLRRLRMADKSQRTEQPTAKHRKEVREKGKVARHRNLARGRACSPSPCCFPGWEGWPPTGVDAFLRVVLGAVAHPSTSQPWGCWPTVSRQQPWRPFRSCSCAPGSASSPRSRQVGLRFTPKALTPQFRGSAQKLASRRSSPRRASGRSARPS